MLPTPGTVNIAPLYSSYGLRQIISVNYLRQLFWKDSVSKFGKSDLIENGYFATVKSLLGTERAFDKV
jgi:hypothetical protein